MARRPRPDLPGVAFHLTTRLQGRAHLLTPGLRTRIVHLLRRQVLVSDIRLLAYVIMTNHLHLVVVQGESPLGRFMQPFLRSAALEVQRRHGLEGHVFERRFRDTPCHSEDHLRRAIAYTHANPVRAGLCRTPGEYRWSSHSLYASDGPAEPVRRLVDVRRGLEAFTPPEASWRSAGRAFYVSFLGGILPGDGAEPDPPPWPPEPPFSGGTDSTHGKEAGRPLPEFARQALKPIDPLVPLDLLRSRYGPRWRLPIRNALVRTVRRAGYSGREIGAFFGLSESAISRILTGQTVH